MSVTISRGDLVAMALSTIEDEVIRLPAEKAFEELSLEAARIRLALGFIRQEGHACHHEGPVEACPKATCDAAALALGERVRRTA